MENIIKHVDAIRLHTDYTMTLLRCLNEHFMIPLVNGEYRAADLVKVEGPDALNILDMVNHHMAVIDEQIDELSDDVATKWKDHSTMTNAERVKEITGDIDKAVELIAQRPDWLDAMKHLNAIAWAFAMGRAAKVEINMNDIPSTTGE